MCPVKPLPDAELIAVDDLLLDPANPRLAGAVMSIDDQDTIFVRLWQKMAVSELVDSIATNGYWQHEELFAKAENGKFVVLEGNRRLAAVKVIVDADLRKRLKIPDPPKLSDGVAETLEKLPVVVSTREDVWEYIGFKHVNGPQTWDSIAKAKYIHRVKTKHGIPLKDIATTIGDQHDTVVRLYRGFLVLQQAQDEDLFHADDAYRTKFPFSHLWTALGYKSVTSFLGVKREKLEKPNPVPKKNLPQLKSLLGWVYGSKSDSIEPLVQRQNPDLRHLAEALASDKGLQKLEAGLPLRVALDATLGDEKLFSNALTNAEQHLREAKSFVATGYTGDTGLLETADKVAKLGNSLLADMRELEATSDEKT